MNEELIITLKKLHLQIPYLRDLKNADPIFKNWEGKTRRTLGKIFGEDSPELIDFTRIGYSGHYLGFNIEMVSRETFDRKHVQNGLREADLLLKDLLEEAETLLLKEEKLRPSQPLKKNVFISHSSKDKQLAKEVTNLLEALGIPSDVIFNSSMPGYGVKPGEDWVETLKAKISTEGVVISLISENYYNSAVSLCEMGATWVLSKSHFPIVLPPLKFEDIKGVIPTKHAIMVNDSERWSELKDELEKIFELTPILGAKWEGKKKDILDRIEKLLTP